MPLLIFHAAIACVSLIAPSRLIASIQRILTNAALMRANARWLAMTAIAQQEFSLAIMSERRTGLVELREPSGPIANLDAAWLTGADCFGGRIEAFPQHQPSTAAPTPH